MKKWKRKFGKRIDKDLYLQTINSKEHEDLALNSAQKSIVMLKNSGVLPLAQKSKVAIVGPNAFNTELLGTWICNPHNRQPKSLVDVAKEMFDVVYANRDFQMCNLVDVETVIYCGGEYDWMSGEAKSMLNLDLDCKQVSEIQSLFEMDKKVVFLNYSGRGNVLTKVSKYVDALLNVWWLGDKMSEAIISIICGEFNPEGKLPISMPRHSAQMPLTYREYNTGRYAQKGFGVYQSAYIDVIKTPLYPFGHGLTYGKINIENVELTLNDNIEVSVALNNQSDYDICETVQVYVSAPTSNVIRPIKELKAFAKTSIKSNTKSNLKLEINIEDLKYVDCDYSKVLAKGIYKIGVGLNSEDLIYKEITL